jgi:hypothetical protein
MLPAARQSRVANVFKGVKRINAARSPVPGMRFPAPAAAEVVATPPSAAKAVAVAAPVTPPKTLASTGFPTSAAVSITFAFVDESIERFEAYLERRKKYNLRSGNDASQRTEQLNGYIYDTIETLTTNIPPHTKGVEERLHKLHALLDANAALPLTRRSRRIRRRKSTRRNR